MSTELPTTFDPAEIEQRWYAHWEDQGLFRPDRPDAQPYTIVNPPPNVTGSLHIGHALDNTLQDIMVRYERLRGKVRYQPIGFELLPRKFPLRQLQTLYELVLDRELDKRNFRKKILSMDILVELNEIEKDVAHRAAKLYRFDEKKYKRKTRGGFNFEL